jgi:hypothetical protein
MLDSGHHSSARFASLQRTAASVALDVGPNRLELVARPRVYRLEVTFPAAAIVNPDETSAQFNK